MSADPSVTRLEQPAGLGLLPRFVRNLLIRSIYRLRIIGADHVPKRGPALLVSNHLSQVDGLIVSASVQRVAGRTDVQVASARAREELAAGHVVCAFAEGSISRTGNLLPFSRISSE